MNDKTNIAKENVENQGEKIPEKFDTPQLVYLSNSANLPDLECLATRGSSCTWK